ncbi:hypothetical protein BLNAU_8327 [Blattamonas nauphoetae]|uniref:Uncharacterized protein n=1 Tax=Blattamonas nauphoetae TaxID=2049346 RepID=A0ABQ9XZ05_9EUKA|nr:hypothetical protein BLNAU_8327 [Blattamonas nauphoetae]
MISCSFSERRASLYCQKPVISAGEQGFKPNSCFFSESISLLLTVSTLVFASHGSVNRLRLFNDVKR